MLTFEQFLLESENPINVKWAVGKDKKYALDKITRSDFTVIYVKPDELIKNTDPEYRVDSNSSKNHIGNRMQKVIDHIKEGNFLDPAIVAYNRYSKDVDKYPIEISNGRHRVAAMKKLGIKQIPVYIMKSDKKDLEKVISVH